MNISKIAGFAVGPIGVAAISLLTVPLTAWYFSAEDIGKISMLQIAVSFCLLFFSLGLDQAYVREYNEVTTKSALFKACLAPGFFLLTTFLVVLFGVEPSLFSNWLFGEKRSDYSILICVCFFSAFIGRFLSLILRMEGRGWAFSISQLLPKIVFLSILFAYILLNSSLTLTQLLIAHTAAFISVVILFGWNTRKQWLIVNERISGNKKRELFQFGLPLVFNGLGFWAMTTFDRIFLKNFSSYEEVGLYSVVNSFAGVATVLQSIFTTIWAPAAYKWHSEGVEQAEFQKVVDKVLIVVVMIFSLAGLLSWVLTYLLPDQYHRGQYIVLACLIYPLLYSLSETTGIGLGIARKTGWSLIATGMAVITNVVCNFWLTPKYGASGAAASTGLSFLVLLIARTEFSIYFHAHISRLKMYVYIGSCVGVVLLELFWEVDKCLFYLVWLAFLLSSFFEISRGRD